MAIFLPLTLLLAGCSQFLTTPVKYDRTHKKYVIQNSHGRFVVKPRKHIELEQKGTASYYGGKFHGRKTATGAKFNMHAYTAAHPTAHLPSVAIVTHKNNSRIVLLNDRGPFAKNRILDCSKKLAQDLGFEKQGHAKVHIKVLKNETLALKQNGGTVDWDGSTRFPLITRNTRNLSHFQPKIVVHHKVCNKHKNNKPKLKISIKKLHRQKKKINYI